MADKGRSVEQIVADAEHYKALGMTDVPLGYDRDPYTYPWSLVSRMRSAGSHRLEMVTSIRFEADHPCGLTLTWWIDTEERDANGQGYYKVRVDLLRYILGQLPEAVREDMRAYLRAGAAAVQKKGEEWSQVARDQMGLAADLRNAAGEA